MNQIARLLAVFLALVLLDSTMGFEVYRKAVHAGTGAYCAVTNRTAFERFDCTSRLFYSRPLWLVVSLLTGLAGGYVTLQAMRTRRW
jgi:hypothetical protein